jgi:Skp family chaperone for outer membrane proteins
MLRKPLLTLILASLFTAPAFAQGDAIKIAVVDLDVVVAQSPAGKELNSKLERFQQQVQAEIDTMTNKAKELRQRLADGVNSLSEDKLAELQKQFEDEGIRMKRLKDDKTREGQKMQNEGLREIEKQLEPIFKQVRDEGGYDIILNRVPGMVVMASERVDITQRVIDRLSAAAPKKP